MKTKNLIRHLTKIVLVLFIATFTSSCMMIHVAHHNVEVDEKFNRDPVCGSKVDSSVVINYSYKNRMYYFDNEECKKVFMQNPEKFEFTENQYHKKNSTFLIAGAVAMGVMMVFMMGFVVGTW